MLIFFLFSFITLVTVTGFFVPTPPKFLIHHELPSRLYAESNFARNTVIGALVSVLLSNQPSNAIETTAIPTVPLYTKKSSDVQSFADIGRGFKLLRPFGFNEFDGAGAGYAVKFASLYDVDENVVVGSTPATADKTSIQDFGELQALGEKLAAKRDGKLVSAEARLTDGIAFYQFQFETPLDMALPRPGSKNNKPTKGIELYELCVSKGRLWSVKATSNDVLFPAHEKTFRTALASFIPRL